MSTQTQTADLLEEMLAEEHQVPCGGVRDHYIPPCGAVATLVRIPTHLCTPLSRGDDAARFKCDQCYAKWRVGVESRLDALGYITCYYCKVQFNNIDEWVRYAPL